MSVINSRHNLVLTKDNLSKILNHFIKHNTNTYSYRLLYLSIIAALASPNIGFAAALDVDLPAQSLALSLQQLGKTAGLTIKIDSKLVEGK